MSNAPNDNDNLPTSSDHVTVAVLGRGFAGIKAIKELGEKYDPAEGRTLQIISIDPKSTDEVGGIAYSDTEHRWTLNVPTEKMSIDSAADKANDFLDFLKQNETRLRQDYPEITSRFEKGEYIARAFYREYLQDAWGKTAALVEEKGITLTTITGIAQKTTRMDKDDASGHTPVHIYYTEAGVDKTVAADITVVAMGNTPPMEIEINLDKNKNVKDSRVIQNPLETLGITRESLLEAASEGQTPQIVLRGFGNTGVDLALAINDLAKDAGVEIEIIAVQRHNEGIVMHQEQAKTFPTDSFKSQTTADGLKAAIDKALEQASFQEGDIINMPGRGAQLVTGEDKAFTPQDVIDAVRGVINDVWSKFSAEDKIKWKDEHDPEYRYLRNRVTRETGAEIQELIDNGTLKLITGQITSVISNGEDRPLEINLLEKRNDIVTSNQLKGEHLVVVNAAGPDQTLEANEYLKNLKQDEVIIRSSSVRGFSFQENSHFAKTNDPSVYIAALSHNNSKYAEDSGIREKRANTEKAMQEVSGKVREIQDARQVQAEAQQGANGVEKRGSYSAFEKKPRSPDFHQMNL